MLPLFVMGIVSVLADQKNSINLQTGASLSECFRNRGVNFQARMPRRSFTAEIICSHLFNVQRDDVHLGTMMSILQDITFQKSVYDMFGMGIFMIDRGQRGDSEPALGTVSPEGCLPHRQCCCGTESSRAICQKSAAGLKHRNRPE